MSVVPRATLPKSERLCGEKAIERLFSHPSRHSLAAYPLRLVYAFADDGNALQPCRMMVSVPKRLLRHAVDRNRVKRQLREAYRHNKYLLAEVMPKAAETAPARTLLLAFLWQADVILTTEEVQQRMRNLLQRVAEKLNQQLVNLSTCQLVNP